MHCVRRTDARLTSQHGWFATCTGSVQMSAPDAVVVGSGPNGLAAAITIARAGRRVVVYEAAKTIGGGCRSAELTLPGFVHDVCSAVYPLALAYPFFRSLPLAAHGLEWIRSPALLAHPLDEHDVVILSQSIEQTAASLGGDAAAYRDVFVPLAESWPAIERWSNLEWAWPRYPLALARQALHAMRSADAYARSRFFGRGARALFAGVAAHGMRPLEASPTAAIGLGLMLAGHLHGWPIVRGGAQRLSNALAAHLRSLGGDILTGTPITSLDDLPPARAILCDLSPRPLLRVVGDRFPLQFRRALERYEYGLGVYKVDWALDAPIPWSRPEIGQAATVHLGGGLEEIASAERSTARGTPPERPFVLLAQPSLFDAERAPAACHTAWAYTHVPHGSAVEMLMRMEAQIERYAPGFRDRVLARSVLSPQDLERHNPNFVGGDIGAGAATLRQLIARPTWHTYSTPLRGLYICSASTPPGVGVHGMCGHLAALRALREVLRE
jgi:phytoene dehydrogenase-like protein